MKIIANISSVRKDEKAGPDVAKLPTSQISFFKNIGIYFSVLSIITF